MNTLNLLTMATSSSSTPLQLPLITIKLDRENFSLWRSTVLSVLQIFDLDPYVMAPKPPAETRLVPDAEGGESVSEPNPAYVTWKRSDRLVLLWLRSTLSDRALSLVVRAASSHAAWVTIEKSFQHQTRARRMHLKVQLQSLSKGALTMLEYIEQKRAIADSLADDLQPISDEDLIGHLLFGLDASYDGFATAFMMAADRLTVDDLVGLLLQEEARQDRGHARTGALLPTPTFQSSPTAAFTADRAPARNLNLHFGMRPQLGNSTGSPRSSSPRPRMICQLCRISGHEAINCRYRNNFTAFPSRCPPQLSRTQPRPPNRKAYIAHHGDSSTIVDPSWYFDSGATDHVTPDLGNLNLGEAYTGGDKLQVGNGSTGASSSSRSSH
ncbi:Retrovirus-related Pol polyprotein from transposon RE1 [Linum grandiflorum]